MLWLKVLTMMLLHNNTLDRSRAGDVLVEIRPVVLQYASAEATASVSPPASETVLIAGTEFFVELWAQQTDPQRDGLTCVFSDFLFDPMIVACRDVSSEVEFAFFSSGSCQDQTGIVDELGGCSFRFPGPGIAPEWVRVASTTMVSTDSLGEMSVTSAPADLGISIARYGDVPTDQVLFSATPPVGISHRPGDFDGDGDVDYTDLAVLLGCMTGPSDDETVLACLSQWPGSVDLDGDGDVDLKDFALFERALNAFASVGP